MSLVLIPGSFDPMTRGHAEMIRKTAGIFDEVVVGVMGQSTKKSMFSLEKRVSPVGFGAKPQQVAGW